ncbi:PEP/pyruvate-binding domain-containing protein [Pseudarthrobacter sulfonivorans]|uniref:PEP/pyruvate-binding domain-containing protein n=1 Tax=Pseudarthrobacter sulfonivorans TaxID=121292 RepID=UPI0028553FA2|nr:PEP/pyruvate-binding domain-containing protein [Pseudarthrobacter sulfonivorans]MDR6415896.1 pyruvate,water dikinase [Pseudarthrobacter sulfonivorans]
MGDDILLPPLGSPAARSRETVGSKAAALSSLSAAGFPVPGGFVVTKAALGLLSGQSSSAAAESLKAAARAAGPGPYAVRSSAAAEDLPVASFAGMYESYLNVAPADLPAAVQRCFDSANADRIRAYESAITAGSGGSKSSIGADAMAVLVQQMVDPAAAGVAFTANPLTGDRTETVISAVPGLAEELVSGVETGEEWIARAGSPALARGAGGVLSVESATAVANAAARVAGHFGCPQDIEWAVDHGGTVFILQARPMTALPDPVSWAPPGKGSWLRNFRLGEWLPEPVTPLFMDWVIPKLDEAYNEAVRRSAGIDVPMGYAQVNGWYYVSPPTPLALPHLLFGSERRAVPYFFNSVVRPIFDPAGADRSVLRALEREWRTECLPEYRHLADTPPTVTATATVPELMDLVDHVAHRAGQYLWFFAATGGAAWKMEMALARFWRRHVASALAAKAIPGSPEAMGYQALLGGLSPTLPAQVPYAVYSIDWYHPTAGEQFPLHVQVTQAEAQQALPSVAADRRRAAEAACRAVLKGTRRLKKFDAILRLAQRYALLREEQVRDFTLGWPLLRRCAAELGVRLHNSGIIAAPEDIYFLTLDALRDDGKPLQAAVDRRRTEWLRQRKLAAPLALGKMPPLLGNAFDRMADSARSTRNLPAGALVGHPASPGRAQGRVRVVDGPEDFARFLPGEVLVAKATAPAWTPLFADAAAVVTDGGNLAAHASLVAREYGIPAVVSTGNATHILRTGQMVTVDGNAGVVITHDD